LEERNQIERKKAVKKRRNAQTKTKMKQNGCTKEKKDTKRKTLAFFCSKSSDETGAFYLHGHVTSAWMPACHMTYQSLTPFQLKCNMQQLARKIETKSS
jgi:hypothetical protein